MTPTRRGKSTLLFPFANLTSAALFMAGLLEGAGFIYGLMGELAVAFLRSTRVTQGVDMALAPRKWRDIWRIMEAGPSFAEIMKRGMNESPALLVPVIDGLVVYTARFHDCYLTGMERDVKESQKHQPNGVRLILGRINPNYSEQKWS
ncbi:hypothetical protein BO85DRAFT_437050 [Aspergillus piperis CBS 112811]|uniref:Uncharacterized protein n=1 Tax=Aspergillus piperis CBS 112811 TaxID=1448313 RepID=A0A8G1R474_9EURO|nr:hypothetical protein BO85DRAFT_437050 [Aspergillus piperis CBS 112811]RAH58953.1 hypothetical protein BO85DRAFT_437050 [Aspergillus piperis CBS 112811]